MEVVRDAMETLASPWIHGQPDHEIYVAMFERSLTIPSAVFSLTMPSTTLQSLLTLLRSLERQIRDPGVSAQEREAARKHGIICCNKFASFLKEDSAWEALRDFSGYATQDISTLDCPIKY